jgi:hypothetical protein
MSLGSSSGSSFDSSRLISATRPVGLMLMSNESPSSRLTVQVSTPASLLGAWLLAACTAALTLLPPSPDGSVRFNGRGERSSLPHAKASPSVRFIRQVTSSDLYKSSSSKERC